MLYRRRLHEQLGQFDEQVFNYWDWDWCLRVAKVGKIVRVPKATTLYAFAAGGDNQSAQLSEKRKQYFHYFCEKHQLGELPMMNFAKMLEQPELKACESESEQLWDGKPLHTRLSSRP
jgi:GT2 family glycosyltransferase